MKKFLIDRLTLIVNVVVLLSMTALIVCYVYMHYKDFLDDTTRLVFLACFLLLFFVHTHIRVYQEGYNRGKTIASLESYKRGFHDSSLHIHVQK
jgi:O-antigen/teichoic acid export membrane protein